MRFLEIITGIILSPILIILGIFTGICKIYSIYDSSFVKAWRKNK